MWVVVSAMGDDKQCISGALTDGQKWNSGRSKRCAQWIGHISSVRAWNAGWDFFLTLRIKCALSTMQQGVRRSTCPELQLPHVHRNDVL